MIDLYTWSTPNGRKVSIMLEECGLSTRAHAVNISKDEQFKPDFLQISPNNRIPAIIDGDNGRSLFESGAILLYLAEKTGKLLATGSRPPLADGRVVDVADGGIGPMIGQVHHFVRNNKGKSPYAEERYVKETHRLYGVLDKRLAQHEYVAGVYYASPTWRFGRGFHASSGTRSTSISTPTWPAGIRRSRRGRRWHGATTFPSSSPASPCRPDRQSLQKRVLPCSSKGIFRASSPRS